MLGETGIRRGQNVDARARRHIVDDARDIDIVGNLREMLDKASLRTLVIVRRHEQQPVRPRLLRILRKLDRVVRIVRSCARDDGDASADCLNDELDGFLVLGIAHGCRLARRSCDDDGVRAARDLIFDDAAELLEVHAIFRKGSDDGDARTSKDWFFHSEVPLDIISFGEKRRRVQRFSPLWHDKGRKSISRTAQSVKKPAEKARIFL